MDQLFDVLKEQMAKRRDSIIDARLITRDTERKAYRAQVAAGTHSGEKLKLTSLGLSRDDAGSIIAPAADVAFRQEYLNRAVVKVRCCVSPSNYLRLSAADSVGSKRSCNVLTCSWDVFCCCRGCRQRCRWVSARSQWRA